MITAYLMTAYLVALPKPARGPALPHPHGHGAGSGLAGVFLRALARAFAWQTARGVFDTLGVAAVAIGLLIAVLAWRRARRGGE